LLRLVGQLFVFQAVALNLPAAAWATPDSESRGVIQPRAANATKGCFGLWGESPSSEPPIKDVNCIACTSKPDSCTKCAPGYAVVPNKVWLHTIDHCGHSRTRHSRAVANPCCGKQTLALQPEYRLLKGKCIKCPSGCLDPCGPDIKTSDPLVCKRGCKAGSVLGALRNGSRQWRLRVNRPAVYHDRHQKCHVCKLDVACMWLRPHRTVHIRWRNAREPLESVGGRGT
jgi:hypothetical protein